MNITAFNFVKYVLLASIILAIGTTSISLLAGNEAKTVKDGIRLLLSGFLLFLLLRGSSWFPIFGGLIFSIAGFLLTIVMYIAFSEGHMNIFMILAAGMTAAYVAAAYLILFSKSFKLALNDRKTASKQSEAEERRELYSEFGENPPEDTEGDQ
jgi:hypothetical protein